MPYDLTYMWNLKPEKQKKNPRAHRNREQIAGCQMLGG